MKIKFIPFYLLSALGLIFIASSWEQFKLDSSQQKNLEAPLGFPQEDKVIVSSKAYNEEESEKVLQNRLLYMGIQPIQITIENQSSHSLILSEKSVEVPLIDSNDVVNKIYQGSIARSIGLKVMGLFFWPFSIASTVDSIVTYEDKTKTKENFLAKSLKRTDETIPAYSTVHRLFFIKIEHLKKEIAFSLSNKDNDSKMHFKITPSATALWTASKSAEELVDNSPLTRINRLRST